MLLIVLYCWFVCKLVTLPNLNSLREQHYHVFRLFICFPRDVTPGERDVNLHREVSVCIKGISVMFKYDRVVSFTSFDHPFLTCFLLRSDLISRRRLGHPYYFCFRLTMRFSSVTAFSRRWQWFVFYSVWCWSIEHWAFERFCKRVEIQNTLFIVATCQEEPD